MKSQGFYTIKDSQILWVLILIAVSYISMGFIDRDYAYKHKADKCLISYEYLVRNDSIFMVGLVIDKKTKKPSVGINIVIDQFRVGTVTKTNGTFEILLPRQKGLVLFDWPGVINVALPYEFQSEDLIKDDTTH